MYLLEIKQREYEYLCEYEAHGNQAPPPKLLGKMKVVVVPSIIAGTTLAEFGAPLDADDQNSNSEGGPAQPRTTKLGPRSLSAQYITDIYLHWVTKTREKESEEYIKTLSGEPSLH